MESSAGAPLSAAGSPSSASAQPAFSSASSSSTQFSTSHKSVKSLDDTKAKEVVKISQSLASSSTSTADTSTLSTATVSDKSDHRSKLSVYRFDDFGDEEEPPPASGPADVYTFSPYLSLPRKENSDSSSSSPSSTPTRRAAADSDAEPSPNLKSSKRKGKGSKKGKEKEKEKKKLTINPESNENYYSKISKTDSKKAAKRDPYAFTPYYEQPELMRKPPPPEKPIESAPKLSVSGNNYFISNVDWNKSFQRILTMPDSFDKYQQLSALYRDFCYAAKTYGRIIISEKFLPDSDKTIKPVGAGGVAGGVKYVVSGILFKFAVDTFNSEYQQWMYGLNSRDDGCAAKAAGHELKGLINMFNTRHVAPRLNYPLLALIDYRGYRLIALSVLPVSKETIMYGSNDGALTVHADNATLNEEMKAAGTFLNLEPHHVGDQAIPLSLCGDIEGHVGHDNAFYCLDFARLFPPERLPRDEAVKFENGGKNTFLFKLLRPEIVKTNSLPLNSDSLSNFMRRDLVPEERKLAANAVLTATARILREIIPSFAATLAKISPVELQNKSYSLTDEIHRVGINCRHLGRLRAAIPPSTGNFRQQFILNEIVARSCKNMLRALWRKKLEELKMPSSEPYLDVALEFINRLLQNTDNFWSEPQHIKDVIQKAFHHALTDAELISSYDLRQSIDLPAVLIRLEKLSRLKLTNRFHSLLKASVKAGPLRLLKVDLKNVSCGLKQLPLMSLSEGKMLLMQAQQEDASRAQNEQLYQLANERFSHGLAANVNDTDILFSWGLSLLSESQVCDKKTSRLLLRESLTKFLRASEMAHEGAKLYRVLALVLLATRSLEPLTCYESMRQAQELVQQVSDVEAIIHKADEMFQSVTPLSSLSELPAVFFNSIDPEMEEWKSDRVSKEALERPMWSYLSAFHFHLLALSRTYSARLTLQASILLRSYGALVYRSGKPGGDSIVARAAQLFALVTRVSKITFPLVSLDQTKILPGPAAVFTKRTRRDTMVMGSSNSVFPFLQHFWSTTSVEQTVVYVIKKKKTLFGGWKKRTSALQNSKLVFKTLDEGDFDSEVFDVSGLKFERLKGPFNGRANVVRLSNTNEDELFVSCESSAELSTWESDLMVLLRQTSSMNEKFLAEFFETAIRDDNWLLEIAQLVVIPKQRFVSPVLLLTNERAMQNFSTFEHLAAGERDILTVNSPITLVLGFDGSARLKEITFRLALGSIRATAVPLKKQPTVTFVNKFNETKSLDELRDLLVSANEIALLNSAKLIPNGELTLYSESDGPFLLLKIEPLDNELDPSPEVSEISFLGYVSPLCAPSDLDLFADAASESILSDSSSSNSINYSTAPRLDIAALRSPSSSRKGFGGLLSSSFSRSLTSESISSSDHYGDHKITYNGGGFPGDHITDDLDSTFFAEEKKSLAIARSIHSQCLARTKAETGAKLSEIVPPNLFDHMFRSYDQLFLALQVALHSSLLYRAFDRIFEEKLRVSFAIELPPTSFPPLVKRADSNPLLDQARQLFILTHQMVPSDLGDFRTGFSADTLSAFSAYGSIEPFLEARLLTEVADSKLYVFSHMVTTPFRDLSEFLSRQLDQLVFSERLLSSPSPEVTLTELHLAHSPVVNGPSLELYAKYVSKRGVPLHTVDLSYTDIRVIELGPFVRFIGSAIISLNIKGCSNLAHQQTVDLLLKHCPNISHLSVWESIREGQLARLLGGLASLQYLDLSRCAHITSEVFDALKPLKYIDLSILNCPLDKKGIKSYLTRHGRGLEALLLVANFQQKPADLVDEGVLQVVARQCPALRLLDITSNFHLNNKAIESLLPLRELEVLRMSGTFDTSDGGKQLADLLAANRKLESIEFRKAEARDWTKFYEELSKPARALRSLCLRGLRLKEPMLAVLSNHAASLSKLDLADCARTMNDNVASKLIKCTNLVELHLDYCKKISKETLLELVTAMPRLVVLGVSACAVTDSFLSAIFLDLTPEQRLQRRALHTLIIARCKLLTERCLDALCHASQLHVLIMSSSHFITPAGLLRICTALPSLKMLDVTWCPNLPKLPSKYAVSTSEEASTNDIAAHELFTGQLTALLPGAAIYY